MASEIIARLPEKYEAALKSQDLYFFTSTLHKHADLNVEFEIRLCPALQKKPITPEPVHLNHDPFSPPYIPNLHIGDLRVDETNEEYVALLNKYSVVPQHFLIATKDFQSQTSPLTPSDLVVIYRLLVAARRAGKNFFAFYNCGEYSGASQPHKHVQFFPLDIDSVAPIEQLAKRTSLETPEKPFTLNPLPYANHVRRLPSDMSFYDYDQLEATLSQAFLQLLDLTVSTIRHDTTYPARKLSYNAWITLEHLHLIPRRFEEYPLRQGEKISINSLGFAGTLLVKSESQLELVKNEGIGKILRGVGLESVHEEQVQGTAAEAMDEVSSTPANSISQL
ncbi:hypothetical protein AMATHDRAFT_1078 [Amanita thiersii Skay4041]|uniref:Uncharacterized protein n=1 Tax=Amanita thiersii Skay4041 TaxID=703135 RepID=A0A2A9P054_9AGAR|nr:hypothetical protein AMATHDRAFT_1078 [Amanita thiersii Skay4041]